jgi:hypothetical protein
MIVGTKNLDTTLAWDRVEGLSQPNDPPDRSG